MRQEYIVRRTCSAAVMLRAVFGIDWAATAPGGHQATRVRQQPYLIMGLQCYTSILTDSKWKQTCDSPLPGVPCVPAGLAAVSR